MRHPGAHPPVKAAEPFLTLSETGYQELLATVTAGRPSVAGVTIGWPRFGRVNAVLTAKGLSAGYADRVIFSGVDLVVPPGKVIGLVGANGAGKSTLLRMLAGLDDGARDAGSVSLNPATATVGYLPQEPERRPGESVLAFVERRTGVVGAAAELEVATAALEAGAAGADDAYAAAFERWMNLGGADLEERTAKVAAALGLAVRLDAPMTSLSGGQAARANLASLLLSRYDIFLLDEPTNDLDIDGLAVLEDFVTKLRAGTVLVSHDRAFLERTVDQVLELDLAQQSVQLFSGGYLAYLEERAIAQQHARDGYEKYADKKAALTDRMRTQSSWADRGVRQARAKAPDKDKHRLSAQVNRTEKLASKIKITERMMDRLEAVDEPRKEWELRMTIAAAPRSGTVAASLRDAVVSFGGFTLGPVNLQVNWADRVVITGPNGAGKSTLIGALLGRVPLSSGSASLGSGISVGEVDQARSLFDGPVPLLEAFAAQVPGQVAEENRTLLAKFGLKAEHVVRPAASLSPGERTRAALALLQARGVNLVVLDEPTNHLDLPAIEQLESALDGYPGTFLLVTHDRRMLESVSVTRRFVVSDGQVGEVDVA
jgi:ATPase subunit of ABC transporter with duplicated ATPase domains